MTVSHELAREMKNRGRYAWAHALILAIGRRSAGTDKYSCARAEQPTCKLAGILGRVYCHCLPRVNYSVCPDTR